jgi:DNA-binding HxlR family transcriptional regulator
MRSQDDDGLRRAAALIGRRWTLELVGVLAEGPHRFTDLRAAIPGVSASMLAGRLRALTDAGVVGREHLPPPAVSSVYRLTETGAGLVPVVAALALWGRTVDAPVRRLEEGRRAA